MSFFLDDGFLWGIAFSLARSHLSASVPLSDKFLLKGTNSFLEASQA